MTEKNKTVLLGAMKFTWNSNFNITNKALLEHTHSSTYTLSLAAFVRNWEAVTETIRPTELQIVTIQPFTENLSVCFRVWTLEPGCRHLSLIYSPLDAALSCPTLCDPMDCSPPGSSTHGVLQARTLDGLPCPPPGDLFDPGIKPMSPVSPAFAAGFFTTEPSRKSIHSLYSASILTLIFTY